MISYRLCLVLPIAALAIGCGSSCGAKSSPPSNPETQPNTHANPDANPAPALPPVVTDPDGVDNLIAFGTEQAFKSYLSKLEEAYRKQQRERRGSDVLADKSASAAPAAESAEPEADADSGDESITNTQEAGVDEGGIVKVHGEHLVVLRRGRLFTIRLGDSALQPVSMIDVFPPGQQGADTWYDEMLIHEDTIVVIGYSYGAGGTELGLFSIDAGGKLAHRDTYYLRSNDYYSSRNYASRLLGGKLIFYMPYALIQSRWNDAGEMQIAATMPGVRNRAQKQWNDIITASQIYQPVQRAAWPVLHTVMTCDLTAPSFTCTAQSVLGPYSRNFYVSAKAVYIWVGGQPWGDDLGYDEDGDGGDRPPTNAVVYRMPLDGGQPGAVYVAGNPTDQFSFKEDADGHLNVVVRAAGGGDAMWAPEVTQGDVALLRLPLPAFSTRVPVAGADAYTALPRPTTGWSFQNRFVGDHVLYGTGSGWGWYDADHDPHVYVYPYAQRGDVAKLALPHGVDRIEALGRDAIVVGTDGKNLHFSSVALAGPPALSHRYTQQGASQGETRSHGFFYKPTSKSGGVLGLPIRGAGRPGYEHLDHGSASVLFLQVSELKLERIGELGSRTRGVNDHCVASCVDWYGNARPIFLRGRLFALLGYELVEGAIADNKLTELRRTDFYSQQPRR